MFHFLRKLVILSNAKDSLHNFALSSLLFALYRYFATLRRVVEGLPEK